MQPIKDKSLYYFILDAKDNIQIATKRGKKVEIGTPQVIIENDLIVNIVKVNITYPDDETINFAKGLVQ